MSSTPAKISQRSTKILIPHSLDPSCNISGVLEQVEPEQDTHGRKIALILHGTLGHKDYLFQGKLALRLPIDSFRFDFRGNYETPGTWTMGKFHMDVEDIQAVVDYLFFHMGYIVHMIVGHSRGSVVAMRWICTSDQGRYVRAFVNVSGRYRMQRIHDRDPTYKAQFEAQGFYEWKVNVARKPVVGKIYPEDVDDFASWDTSLIWNQFPSTTHVLTIQGMKDEVVPPYDAIIYARAFGSRLPGTHNLHFIEDGNHNLAGHNDEVIETILSWLSACEGNNVRTGIWQTGLRGRL